MDEELQSSHFGEEGFGFSALARGDSLFRSIEAQLPLMQFNSVFSNIGPDELLQNNALALSRQESITGRPLTLQQEEKAAYKPEEL